MKVTYIRWKDAWSQEAADPDTPANPPALCELQEVGFLVAESDEAVSISMELEEEKPGRWRLHIPKANIVERRDMEIGAVFPPRKKRSSMKIQPESKAHTVNPKDLFAVRKLSLSKFPAVAILHANHAMADGAVKYGPYNWRDKAVLASIYIDACKRHVEAWFDGEETAADSGVHHLGHALGCLGILLDAQESGMLIDDRPVTPKNRGLFGSVLSRINALLARKAVMADDNF